MKREQDKPAERTLKLTAETIRNLDTREIAEGNLEQVAGASGLRPTCVPDSDFSCYICVTFGCDFHDV